MNAIERQFHKEWVAHVKALGPAIKGSLTQFRRNCGRPGCKKCRSGERHLTWQLSYYSDGTHRNCHVGPGQLEAVRKSLANGRALEHAMSANCFKLVKLLKGKEV
jgi:hypothetical protein